MEVFKKVHPRQAGGIKFGPNGVAFEIRRARRDIGGVPLRDDFGEVARHPKTGEILWEPLRDENGDIIYHDEVERHESHNLTCNAGLEAAKSHLFNTAGNIAKYIALSDSDHEPAAGDTTLADEIASGGLERAAGTYAGDGTGVCSITHEFTASATHTDVQLMGLFDAASAGNLYFEAKITAATLISGDKITGEWNPITLS